MYNNTFPPPNNSNKHQQQDPLAAEELDDSKQDLCFVQRKKTVMTMVLSYARDVVLFSLLFILTAYATYQNT